MTEQFDHDTARGAYRVMSEAFAHGADRGLGDVMAAVFTRDGILISPHGHANGREAIRAVPAMLAERFRATRHEVLNQTISSQEEENLALGETYCNAYHLLPATSGGKQVVVVWRVRYQDQLRREYGTWYLAKREAVLDWIENIVAELPPK